MDINSIANALVLTSNQDQLSKNEELLKEVHNHYIATPII